MRSIMEPREPVCCYTCGAWGVLHEHHIFFGRKQRRISEHTGLKVHICLYCHEDNTGGIHGCNKALDDWLKAEAQKVFEKTHTREEFMKLFGRNYIMEDDMNKVFIMGRLTRDPEVRYIENDNSRCIAKYTLAVDRKGGKSQDGGQTADFINVTAFDHKGEFAERYFSKGMRVLVSGKLSTGSYTGKDGRKVYTTEVIIDDQEFADSKGVAAPRGEPIGAGFMHIPDGVDDNMPWMM